MSDSQPTPKRTRDQQKFIDWARQHLRDWEQRDADMLEACKQHQLARECRECIKLGGCVRYACEGNRAGSGVARYRSRCRRTGPRCSAISAVRSSRENSRKLFSKVSHIELFDLLRWWYERRY